MDNGVSLELDNTNIHINTQYRSGSSKCTSTGVCFHLYFTIYERLINTLKDDLKRLHKVKEMVDERGMV